MELSTVFGVLGGIVTSIRLIPQMIKSFMVKKTEDISMLFIIFLNLQALFLILYGMTKPDMIIMMMNIFPAVCSISMFGMKIKYEHGEKIRSWFNNIFTSKTAEPVEDDD